MTRYNRLHTAFRVFFLFPYTRLCSQFALELRRLLKSSLNILGIHSDRGVHCRIDGESKTKRLCEKSIELKAKRFCDSFEQNLFRLFCRKKNKPRKKHFRVELLIYY